MRLYTWQAPNFDIVKDTSDVKKYADNCLKESYDWLFKILGTDKVIWCWGREENHSPCHTQEQVLWVLDVPEDEIVATLNSGVWGCIIGGWNYIPANYSWWYDLPEKEWEAKEKEWLKSNPMRGWDKLFYLQTEEEVKTAQFLIQSPVKEEWVVSKHHHTGWDIDDIFSGICRRGFVKKEDAYKFREAILSALGDFPYEEEMKKVKEDYWVWYCKWDEEKLLEKYNLTEDDNGDIIPKKGKE